MKLLTLIVSLFIATASTAATKTSHKEYAAKGSTTIKVFDKENVHYAPDALGGFNEVDANGIIRLVNGRIILKKIKVPHYERNVKVDIKTTMLQTAIVGTSRARYLYCRATLPSTC